MTTQVLENDQVRLASPPLISRTNQADGRLYLDVCSS